MASDMMPEIRALGLDSLIVRFAWTPSDATAQAIQQFQARLQETPFDGITEIASALASVIVTFDRSRLSRDALRQHLTQVLGTLRADQASDFSPTRRWHIPVAFGDEYGPQLSEAAQMAGVTQATAISELTGEDLTVLAIGFAPGQPYIGLLANHWDIPRQTELTPKVPAGALVVAVRQLVLFTTPSVTGWRQVGYTAFRPFVLDRPEPFALKQGDALRFHVVTSSDMQTLDASNHDGLGGARCEVLR